jgi:hypothetical protein
LGKHPPELDVYGEEIYREAIAVFVRTGCSDKLFAVKCACI